MSEPPIVSIATSCYGMTAYLESFFKNVREQTLFPNCEVLLDLNCPSEKDMAIVERAKGFFGANLQVFTREQVVPLPTSWNRCVQAAQADSVCIWNVDDRRTADSLAVQYKSLHSSPVNVSAAGPFKVVSEYGSSMGRLISAKPDSLLDVHRGMYLGPFFMFRRDVLSKTGLFDEQLQSAADYDFAMRLASHGEVVFTRELLGYFLNAGQGTSTRRDSKNTIERTVVELRYGLMKRVDWRYLEEAISYSIPQLLWNGEWHSAAEFVGPWRPEEVKSRLRPSYVLLRSNGIIPRVNEAYHRISNLCERNPNRQRMREHGWDENS